MEPQKRAAVRIRPKTRAGAAHRAAVFTSIDAPGPTGWSAAVNDVWHSLGATKQDARGA